MNKMQKLNDTDCFKGLDDKNHEVVKPNIIDQERMVEAMLFASSSPLSVAAMLERMPKGCDLIQVLDNLKKFYQQRGINLVKINSSYAFRTSFDLKFLLKKDIVESRKLSKAAMETLAIIAYHNNSTRAEIEEIRGVSVSSGTLDILMELGWVKLGRRRKTPGRPITFVITEIFMDYFGLEKLEDLPGIDELKDTGLIQQRAPFFKAINE